MQYMPLTRAMNRVGGAPFGDKHTMLLFDQIESIGAVQYAFLLAVYDDAKQAPVYFVASEVNEMAGLLGGGSHCLGVFDGSGHANMGFSDDWADPRKFFPEAMRIASERFGVPFMQPQMSSPAPQNTSRPAAANRKPWWRFCG